MPSSPDGHADADMPTPSAYCHFDEIRFKFISHHRRGDRCSGQRRFLPTIHYLRYFCVFSESSIMEGRTVTPLFRIMCIRATTDSSSMSFTAVVCETQRSSVGGLCLRSGYQTLLYRLYLKNMALFATNACCVQCTPPATQLVV